MRVYRKGLISEVIHSRINGIKSGEKPTVSFSETLKAMMPDTETKIKTVGVNNGNSGTSVPKSISGDSLLYAVRNASTDTTASSVLNMLGFSNSSSGNSLKTAADSLTAEIKNLTSVIDSDDEAIIKTGISDLTEKYNSLQSLLNSTYTGSGAIYANLFRMTSKTAAESLAEAGITIDESGLLTFSPESFKKADISSFLSSAASAASTVSSYSSAIKSQGITSILGGDEDDDSDSGSLLSSYYNSLTGFYS